ncbi:MAG: site-2 protease family protein [Gammaproteobacteria bacterium]|nr:site-2 protease family protein [Gammaproteobacteria bacterium]NIN61039.1 site-2 protease family protein [Gammaproteobacteria bacterium]NIO62662.1 site-2 protease family protein [Gammaproteobacteria bacterium]NIP49421.1 site-2 protease family protein [Gammaproteobacteria bacterium]NIQ10645.1 site-2 protease family protein [Gammaproteobacteria bacterium]
MQELGLIETVIAWSIPILFGITVHEVAHGWVANSLGDSTARLQGRLTLNPIRHIDPVGTILVPALMVMLTGFIFGWAKPVPVNWQRLGHPRRDMALVAAAGPLANLVMMLIWAFIAKLVFVAGIEASLVAPFILTMVKVGIIINIILMVLNLLPLLPLDGGRVMTSLLPPDLAEKYARLEPYGLIILVVLLVTGVLVRIIGPIIFGLEHLIYQLL